MLHVICLCPLIRALQSPLHVCGAQAETSFAHMSARAAVCCTCRASGLESCSSRAFDRQKSCKASGIQQRPCYETLCNTASHRAGDPIPRSRRSSVCCFVRSVETVFLGKCRFFAGEHFQKSLKFGQKKQYPHKGAAHPSKAWLSRNLSTARLVPFVPYERSLIENLFLVFPQFAQTPREKPLPFPGQETEVCPFMCLADGSL